MNEMKRTQNAFSAEKLIRAEKIIKDNTYQAYH